MGKIEVVGITIERNVTKIIVNEGKGGERDVSKVRKQDTKLRLMLFQLNVNFMFLKLYIYIIYINLWFTLLLDTEESPSPEVLDWVLLLHGRNET